MKKIGDKTLVLSPITGFRTQKLFRKPSELIAIFNATLDKQNGFAKPASG